MTGSFGPSGCGVSPGGWHPEGHLAASLAAIGQLGSQVDALNEWGRRLAAVLTAGGRVLAAGNGGSAAQAQHLTAELVGRYTSDRPPFSAVALTCDTSTLTALANDYGPREIFARQVRAHGRSGDVLVMLSTSGASANLVEAAVAARQRGLTTFALTGGRPNPLADGCDEAVCVEGLPAPSVQEAHLVAVHLLCSAFDAALLSTGYTEVLSVGTRRA